VGDPIKIGGIMHSDGCSLLRLMSAPPNLDAAGLVLSALAEHDISLELMVHTIDHEDGGCFAVVVAFKDLERSLEVMERIRTELEAQALSYLPDVAVVSVFGPHLREKPRIPGLMFTAIASAGVPVLAIANSISSVSCVVEGTNLNSVIDVLSEVFWVPQGAAPRPKTY
jgi:aspartate kinase